jgi:hypothetical protein
MLSRNGAKKPKRQKTALFKSWRWQCGRRDLACVLECGCPLPLSYPSPQTDGSRGLNLRVAPVSNLPTASYATH